MTRRGWLGTGIDKLTDITQKVTKAQATADNARQMVLNRDVTLKDLQADAATIPDIINAAATEHARMTEDFEARIAAIELTPGPAGRDGADGPRGPAGADGQDGSSGRDGTDGAPGKDGRNGIDGAPGTNGKDGATGPAGKDGAPGKDAAAGVTQIEYRDGIAVPAVLSLLGLAATVDVTITWSTAFPDTNYTIVKPQTTPTAASLIGRTDATVKSKTTTGCVITVTTTALLAVGQVTLSALAYRKA